MNVGRSRLTIVLVLTAITVITLLSNLMVQAERWIVVILSITIVIEIVWLIGYFNGRGRK